MSGGSDLNPFKAAENLVNGGLDTISKAGEGLAGIVKNVLDNPLPIIETVALTFVLGPEGLALGLEASTTAAVANAAVMAANGAKMENIAIAAATSYLGAQAGQAAGEAYSPIEMKTLNELGPQYADEAMIKQIVTSSSATAATTALNGGNFKQILTSGVSGAVNGYMTDTLKNAGYSGVDKQVLSNSVSAATRAILNGTDVSTAIGQSVAATALSATIQGRVGELNKNNELGKSLAEQFDTLKTSAQDYFTNTLSPLQEKTQATYTSLTNAKSTYDTLYSTYDTSYKSYLDNKNNYDNYDKKMVAAGYSVDEDGNYYKLTGGHMATIDDGEGGYVRVMQGQQYETAPTKASFLTAANADAKVINDISSKITDAATTYKDLSDTYGTQKTDVLNAQTKYNTDFVAKTADINNQITELNNVQDTLVKNLGEDVGKYQTQLKTDTSDLAKQIAEDAAKRAQIEIANQRTQIEDEFKKVGYTPSNEEIDAALTDRNKILNSVTQETPQETTEQIQAREAAIAKAQQELQAKADAESTTRDEAIAAFANVGYTPTEDDIKAYVGNKLQAQAEGDITAKYDPLSTTRAEALAAFAKEGYKPSDEELNAYIGNKFQVDSEKGISTKYDPLSTNAEEAQKILAKYGVNSTDPKIIEALGNNVSERNAQEAVATYTGEKRSQDPLYYDAVKRAYDFAISQGKSPDEASAFATAYGSSDYGAKLLHTSGYDTAEAPAFKVDISGVSLTADGDPEKVKNFDAPPGTKLASWEDVDNPDLGAFYDPETDAWLLPEKPVLEGVPEDQPITLNELTNYQNDLGEYSLPNEDGTFHKYDSNGNYIGLYDENGDLITLDPNLDPYPNIAEEDNGVPPPDDSTIIEDETTDENAPETGEEETPPAEKLSALYGLNFNVVPTTAAARKASYSGRVISPLVSGATQNDISPVDTSVSSSGTTDTGQAYNWKAPHLTAQGLSTGVPMDINYSAIYDPTKSASPLAAVSGNATQSGIDPSLAAVLGLKASENPSAAYYNYGAQTPQLSSFSATPFQSSLSTIPSATDFSNSSGSMKKYAKGGDVMASPLMAAGGVPHKGSHYVQGAGGGQDDLIDARLADGEYVFDADIVAALGDGSNKEGAKKLDAMREAIRKHKRSAPADAIPPKAKSPLAYLKGTK